MNITEALQKLDGFAAQMPFANPNTFEEIAAAVRAHVAKLELSHTRLKALREAMGYVENGSDTEVSLGQDDATKAFLALVGNTGFHNASFEDLLDEIVKYITENPSY